MAAYRTGLAQAGPSALFMRGAVLIVAGLVRAPAGRGGAARVQDPGEVAELDPGIVAFGLEFVVAGSGEVVQLEYQVPGGTGPGGAGEGGDVEPDGVWSGRVGAAARCGSAAGCGPLAGGAVVAGGSGLAAAGRGAAAAVGDGPAVRSGDGDAPC